MHVLNADKSSEYFDSLVEEREDSAVRVIHCAWLEHSSTLGRLEHLEPASPLDMLVLYRAAAETFKDWAPGTFRPEELTQGGRVSNWEQAKHRLQCVTDQESAALATRFANQVVALSENAATAQDLNYYVELFLHCIQDKQVIDGIVNGSISRDSEQLTDLDLW